MVNVNKHIIIGHLGNDPALRYTPNNVACAAFSVATTRAWKKSNGEFAEKTQWHRVVVWGERAERAAKALAKGTLVYVEGEHEYTQWDDREGGKHFGSQINAYVAKPMNGQPRIKDGEAPPAELGETVADEASPPPTDEEVPF